MGIVAQLGRRTLAGILGVVAAGGLMTSIPLEESGRTVDVAIAADGSATVKHVRGPEYLRSYADIVGVWTICDGLTRGVKRGQVETREGCARRLEAELIVVADASLACVPTLRDVGRDYQRQAFISLAYNIGTPAACSSTAAKRFRVRDWRRGCDAFLMWNKAGRPLRVVPGLTARRQRERAVCLRGVA